MKKPRRYHGECCASGGPAAKTLGACGPSGFGLVTSLGTPFTMIPPRLFQIMSHSTRCTRYGSMHTAWKTLFTLHIAHCILHTIHCIARCILRTANCTINANCCSGSADVTDVGIQNLVFPLSIQKAGRVNLVNTRAR